MKCNYDECLKEKCPNYCAECEIENDENWTTYWWEIVGEDSDLCGEEFFTELKDADAIDHKKYAQSVFPNEKLHCLGKVTEYEAECMGLDTY